jgi:hypothetical protein
MTLHGPNEQCVPDDHTVSPAETGPIDAEPNPTTPRHTIDLFHALRIGCRKASGCILTGSFLPDFSGGEYRAIFGEYMEFSAIHPKTCIHETCPGGQTHTAACGILVAAGEPISVVTVRYTAGSTAEARLSVSGPVTAGREHPLLIQSHRGFGFAFLFPIPECRPETVIELLSRSLAHELHANPADIEVVRASLRERFIAPGTDGPNVFPGRTSPA